MGARFMEGFCKRVSQIPVPSSQIPETGIWVLERVLTTTISPTENCYGQNELQENQIPVVQAKYFQISASAADIGYFHGIWDLRTGIWELRLQNPPN